MFKTGFTNNGLAPKDSAKAHALPYTTLGEMAEPELGCLVSRPHRATLAHPCAHRKAAHSGCVSEGRVRMRVGSNTHPPSDNQHASRPVEQRKSQAGATHVCTLYRKRKSLHQQKKEAGSK